jgi:hypothetical protein
VLGAACAASLAVVAVVLAGAERASAAEVVVDRPRGDAPIAAHLRTVAYSSYDATAGVYRLRVKTGDAAPHDVPVPPRSVPFDVSVGRAYVPVKGHENVLVYSRCAQEPRPAAGIAPGPDWRTARSCALYEAPFYGPERRIVGAGEGVLPSVSGGTLAFARFGGARGPRVIVRRLNRAAPPSRVLGGPSVRGGGQGPAGIAVFGSRVAVTWRAYAGSEGQDSWLFVADMRANRTTVVRRLAGGGMSGHAIVGATWLNEGLQWGEICAGDPGGCRGRVRYGRWAPGRPPMLTVAPLGMTAYATGATTTWTLRGCPPPFASTKDEPCDLVAQAPAPLVPPGT